jgi:hypothetical protein
MLKLLRWALKVSLMGCCHRAAHAEIFFVFILVCLNEPLI